MQILAIAFEEWVLGHMQHNVHITGGTSVQSGISVSAIQNPRPVFHACGNFHLHRVDFSDQPLASALGAWVLDHRARALAYWTASSHAEESLLIPHLPLPVAME